MSVEGILFGDISKADADDDEICGMFDGVTMSPQIGSSDGRSYDLPLPFGRIINVCARKKSDTNSVAKV